MDFIPLFGKEGLGEILGNHGVNIKSPSPPLGKGETWIIDLSPFYEIPLNPPFSKGGIRKWILFPSLAKRGWGRF